MSAQLHFLVPFKSNVEYLKETLDSIMAQSAREWRSTVFDDSSRPDEVRSLIESYGDSRLDVKSNAVPRGIGGNWNTALVSAEAPFACLVHADDILSPSYILKVLQLHSEYPDTYGVFTGVRIIDHRGRRRRVSIPDLAKKALHPFPPEPHVVEGDRGLRSLLRGDFIFCPTVTYRVARLVHPVFDEQLRMSLDLRSFADALIRGERFVGTQEACYFYRRHRASTTSLLNSDASRFKEEIQTYHQIADMAQKASFMSSARTGHRALIVKAHFLYVALKNLVAGKPQISRQMLRILFA